MTKELFFVKNVFEKLNRETRLQVLNNSNLNDIEIELLTKRLIHGDSYKVCAEYFNLEVDTINKKQNKAAKKLYTFLNSSLNNPFIFPTNILYQKVN